MSEGFFLMHRGWRDNPVFRGEFSRADAWVWLIENACWKPTRHDINGTTVTLDRGQLSASVRQMADAWGWSKSAVDRFLARLETETMIVREAGHGKLVLTICNYAKYQDKMEAERDTSGTATGTRAGHERDIKEQGNKETSDEVAKATPSQQRASKPKLVRMSADWVPGPLPADIASLVALWPPGRFEREVANTRDYWLDKTERRPGWDRTLHNRIRDIHDRVMRENRNGPGRPEQHLAPSGRPIGRTEAAARAVAERIQSARTPAAPVAGGSERALVALPNPVRPERDEHGGPYRMAVGGS